MGFWDFLSKDNAPATKIEEVETTPQTESSALGQFLSEGGSSTNRIVYDVFDGEKTAGELGAVYDSYPDHLKLRLRAFDMNIKTDIVKIITGKFFKWVVGSGLKLQFEPNETVLEMSGIDEDYPTFKKQVEALFSVYANSKYSDYQNKDNFHEKGSQAFQASFLGGDTLCVVRIGDHGPNIQVIDGQQVETPTDDKDKAEGNVIKHGIEINKKGEHVAFWVCIDDIENLGISHQRYEAYNENGNLMAWMIYGDKARMDHHRGIPVITSILEKVAKLDRFVEASVTKAEQTANVVYAFEHATNSTGENILTTSLSSKKGRGETDESIFEKNGRTAHALKQSVSGVVMNLTPDSKLVNLESKSEMSFDVFFRAVFVALCASVDIPEEVALQKYEQNYSSSRAAINGWEHIVEIYRKRFSDKFYDPFFRVFLEYQILKGKIKSNGFLVAKKNDDAIALEAYYASRFSGKKMPHIDPLKEAKAIRELLGDSRAPLISHEQATESMGSGDWAENYKKYQEEDKLIPKEKDVTGENNGKKPNLDNRPKS